MKNSIFTVLAALVLYPAGAQPVTPQDRRRAAELVERMTLDEKIGQLVQQRGGGAVTGPDKTELSVERLVREGRCGSVFNIKSFEETERLQRIAVEESRLGIPLLIGADVIHGFRTIFPINLAVAASWDPAAAESLARVSAREASALGIHWTFSPMCDVSRDPRWGRVSEGAGEDPYLGARVAEAMVRGYQGDLSDPSSVLACVKHFAAYGAPQAGREYHAVDMSERVFRDSYLPPYRAALDAGAATVMTSFNDLDGVPATANRWLMRNLLRDELGFGGFVVTDYGTIGELKAHGVAGDDAQAAELALRAGVNMDMMSAAYLFHAAELVREGRIPESLIDSLCCEVLAVKFRLGLFDDPFRYQAKEREKCYYAPEHLDAARRVARSSMVLLENRGGVLPLKKGSRIALVGPFADSRWDLIGSWVHFAEAGRTSTFLDGLRARFGADRVTYARGCDPHKALEGGISEAVAAAAKSDVVLVALGLKAGESGEAASLASLALPDAQRDLLESLKQTGKPIVVLLVTGRPMELAREAELADALLLTWYPGTMAGEALADVVSGDYNPSGRLPGGISIRRRPEWRSLRRRIPSRNLRGNPDLSLIPKRRQKPHSSPENPNRPPNPGRSQHPNPRLCPNRLRSRSLRPDLPLWLNRSSFRNPLLRQLRNPLLRRNPNTSRPRCSGWRRRPSATVTNSASSCRSTIRLRPPKSPQGPKRRKDRRSVPNPLPVPNPLRRPDRLPVPGLPRLPNRRLRLRPQVPGRSPECPCRSPRRNLSPFRKRLPPPSRRRPNPERGRLRSLSGPCWAR